MTTSKDLKRLVRARMAKTGESYTAARAQIVKKSEGVAPPGARPPAERAGMADETVRARTGRTWEEWTALLDRHGAAGMRHPEIARVLRERFDLPGWWAQAVTVGYERLKGRRAVGQRMDGTYEAARSRTFGVAVTRLYDSWARAAVRRKWLGAAGLTLRTSARPRYLRFRHDDGSVVVVGFTAKGRSKSSVSVQHGRLRSRAAADARKAYWTERLDALRDELG